MDPLTALGVVSSVFACVSFASDLFHRTIEISRSTDGCSDDTLKLDTAYGRLASLCGGLKDCIGHQVIQAYDKDYIQQGLKAVEDLSKICKDDCEKLLHIMEKLKTKDGANGKWKNLRVAVETVLKKKSLEKIEERLLKVQIALTVHICTLTNYCASAHSDRLQHLQIQSLELQSNQADTLDQIRAGLEELQGRVDAGLEAAEFRFQRDSFTPDDVDCLQQQLQSLSISEEDASKRQSFLNSLTFESRPVRHAQITIAHKQTFAWALESDSDYSILGIGDWLKDSDGIFWVSGKPGSGKSTLMRFIADSPIAANFISKWAQPKKAIIASHYFWLAGTLMQRSLRGLLQTLLYDVFRQDPSLIDQTCSERWATLQSAGSWSVPELHEALQIVSKSNNETHKFFFFIDGIDEYSGDHEERVQLCQTFKDLAAPGNMKFCLSSRPWNVFEEAFGVDFPKLYLQDLTRNDIQNYVQSRLEEHPRWATVSAQHSNGQWLVSEITAKSNGVFLWVCLVTKLLRESLTNRDSLSELHNRLRSFPSELKSFFKSILESVEPFYQSHMSTMLQIATVFDEHIPDFLLYHFHAQEYEDEDFAINFPIRLMSEFTLQDIEGNTSWHLDSRTRGLLEIHEDGSVTFLHRTVRDFLNSEDMQQVLSAQVHGITGFNPVLSVMKAYVAMIKASPIPSSLQQSSYSSAWLPNPSTTIRQYLDRFLEFAQKLEVNPTGDLRHHQLLDELDRSLTIMLAGPSTDTGTNGSTRLCQLEPNFFRRQAVNYGLFSYLQSRVDRETRFLATVIPFPFMQILTSSGTCGVTLQQGRGTNLIACLLGNSAIDPNKQNALQKSSWTMMLDDICALWSQKDMMANNCFNFLLQEKIIRSLLTAGADPNVEITGHDSIAEIDEGMTAAEVYLELCGLVTDQSLPLQERYLEVLEQVLGLSKKETVRAVCQRYQTIISTAESTADKSKAWRRSLPFLSRIDALLLLHAGRQGLDSTDTWFLQDRITEEKRSSEQSSNSLKRKRKKKRKDNLGNERPNARRKV